MDLEQMKDKLRDLAENGGGVLFLGNDNAQLNGLQADILLSFINLAYASGFKDGVETVGDSIAKRLRGDL